MGTEPLAFPVPRAGLHHVLLAAGGLPGRHLLSLQQLCLALVLSGQKALASGLLGIPEVSAATTDVQIRTLCSPWLLQASLLEENPF